jgi:hypothetical protein
MGDWASVLLASFERAPWGYTLTLAIIIALIKGWPAISDAALRAKTAIAEGRRSDMDDMLARVATLESKVEKATAVAVKAQMQMTYVTAALSMVSAELERKDPGNPVLKQARDLVAQATHEDEPWGPMVAQISKAARRGDEEPA